MHLPLSAVDKKRAVSIYVDPGATSEWTEAGAMLDALYAPQKASVGLFGMRLPFTPSGCVLCRNHGTWNLPAGNYQVTVGIKAEPFDHSAQPKIVPLADGVFDASKHDSQIQVDASTRGSKRVRHVGADFLEILDSLKAQGKVPGE